MSKALRWAEFLCLEINKQDLESKTKNILREIYLVRRKNYKRLMTDSGHRRLIPLMNRIEEQYREYLIKTNLQNEGIEPKIIERLIKQEFDDSILRKYENKRFRKFMGLVKEYQRETKETAANWQDIDVQAIWRSWRETKRDLCSYCERKKLITTESIPAKAWRVYGKTLEHLRRIRKSLPSVDVKIKLRERDYQKRRMRKFKKKKCELCGSIARLELHHKIPFIKMHLIKEAGSIDWSKVTMTVCRKCHRQKIHDYTA